VVVFGSAGFVKKNNRLKERQCALFPYYPTQNGACDFIFNEGSQITNWQIFLAPRTLITLVQTAQLYKYLAQRSRAYLKQRTWNLADVLWP
jgi:hypothetical protein